LTSKKGDHGLLKQIHYVEENIKLKERLGKDASFEMELVEAWREWLPGGRKHHLWLKHSANVAPWPKERHGVSL